MGASPHSTGAVGIVFAPGEFLLGANLVQEFHGHCLAFGAAGLRGIHRTQAPGEGAAGWPAHDHRAVGQKFPTGRARHAL